MIAKDQHIYLAAGFFNERQVELCEWIEKQGMVYNVPIYSPRLDGGVLPNPSTPEQRRDIFKSNCRAIDQAGLILVCVDDFDPGVIWELGYAYGHHKNIMAYSDVPGRGLNVMLAQSCNKGFLNGRSNLASWFKALSLVKKGILWTELPKEMAWEGDVN